MSLGKVSGLFPSTQTGPWFNIKVSSHQYRKSHCGDKPFSIPCHLHNGNSYTGKMTSLYWIRALVKTVSMKSIHSLSQEWCLWLTVPHRVVDLGQRWFRQWQFSECRFTSTKLLAAGWIHVLYRKFSWLHHWHCGNCMFSDWKLRIPFEYQ